PRFALRDANHRSLGDAACERQRAIVLAGQWRANLEFAAVCQTSFVAKKVRTDLPGFQFCGIETDLRCGFARLFCPDVPRGSPVDLRDQTAFGSRDLQRLGDRLVTVANADA